MFPTRLYIYIYIYIKYIYIYIKWIEISLNDRYTGVVYSLSDRPILNLDLFTEGG